jgi:hypothetical protein
VKLDGMMWLHSAQKGLPTQKTSWMIWFNPNAALYEDVMPFCQNYGDAMGSNVLVFNYRGVGNSESYIHCAHDMVKDGEAVFKLSFGLSPTPL